MAGPSGDVGQAYKKFEDNGGERWSMRQLVSLKKMDVTKAQNRLRELLRYAAVAGIFDQEDIEGAFAEAKKSATIN
jgi:hypothetical protein